MIRPQMATMFCFLTTDAAIAPGVLQAALADAVEDSFNMITVDGDMSTNDCVIALASGKSGADGRVTLPPFAKRTRRSENDDESLRAAEFQIPPGARIWGQPGENHGGS